MINQSETFADLGPESLYAPGLPLSDELIHAVEAAPRGEDITYGATPFDKLISLRSQEDVLENRQHIIRSYIGDVPFKIASYVKETFKARFWARLDANDENFNTRLLHDDLLTADPRLHSMILRGRTGKASPAELMLIRDQLGIRSLEVACLTHPYGENIKEQLPQMQESVRSAVEILGGEYTAEPEPRYAMKEILRDEKGEPIAVLMTRKRDFGTLPNGTNGESSAIVRERSSFILRIDKDSRFRQFLYDQEVIDAFTSIVDQDKATQQEMLEQFKSSISMLIEFDVFSEAIPIATTTYVFDYHTTDLVNQEQARHPNVLTDDIVYSDQPDEEKVNEVQRRLEQITETYKHDVYRKFFQLGKKLD